jgi:hypothetical protein
VPLARHLADVTSRRLAAMACQSGLTVPCRKGCTGCCHYFLPLSIPEAMRLWDDVSALPAWRQHAVLGAFNHAAGRLLKASPPPCGQGADDRGDAVGLTGLSQWYQNLQIACPLLAANLCGMYPRRPIACRAFLVAGLVATSSDPCSSAKIVPTPVDLVHALGLLAARLEGTPVEAVAMPMTLAWAMENRSRRQRTFPARMLVETFVTIVRNLAKRTKPALATDFTRQSA